MSIINDNERKNAWPIGLSINPLFMIAFAMAAIVTTFVLANSPMEFMPKTVGFGGIVATFLAGCGGLYFVEMKRRGKAEAEFREAEIERALTSLDEAGQFFTGSLKAADTFRLVVSRVGDVMEFRSAALFLLNLSRTHLCVAHAEGSGADSLIGRDLPFDEGLAGQALTSKTISVDGYLDLDTDQDYGASAAIPLMNGTEVFGVLQFFYETDFDIATLDPLLLEAIASRVAPLMLNSIAYERSQKNALTDVTTDLPNERAFYLILENQIAESIRKGSDRPLTILAVDIKNFEDINKRFGHAAGDRVLNFVAGVIKDNLRQMDFLARSIGDEFLAILPTATQDITHDIMARVHTGFFQRKFKINDTESVEIELHIGWASFAGDGDTPGQLLSLAQLRKEQSKSLVPNKVLFFPHEAAV